MNFNILGISVRECRNTSQYNTLNETIYYSGDDYPHHRYGVTVMTSKDTNKVVNVKKTLPYRGQMKTWGHINFQAISTTKLAKGKARNTHANLHPTARKTIVHLEITARYREKVIRNQIDYIPLYHHNPAIARGKQRGVKQLMNERGSFKKNKYEYRNKFAQTKKSARRMVQTQM